MAAAAGGRTTESPGQRLALTVLLHKSHRARRFRVLQDPRMQLLVDRVGYTLGFGVGVSFSPAELISPVKMRPNLHVQDNRTGSDEDFFFFFFFVFPHPTDLCINM